MRTRQILLAAVLVSCLAFPVSSREKPDCLAPASRLKESSANQNGFMLELDRIEAFPEGKKQKQYFIEAVRFFNEVLLTIPFVEKEHLITLFEILRGDHRNRLYSSNLRLRENRLETFDHIMENTRAKQDQFFRQFGVPTNGRPDFMELVNRRFDHHMNAIAVAARFYDFIIDSQMFGTPDDEHTGFRELTSNKEDEYPYDGHHRFAWFVMNYVLVKNDIPPVYFSKSEVARRNDHNHSRIIVNRAPLQRYEYMQASA